MHSVQSVITQVWEVEQEILDVFHKICTENGLRYSLAYGTLLGAVRHQGFIPWDDDIDIMMPREDYEKLIRIWGHTAPENYILVDGDIYPDYTNNFAKIVKDHTTFLQFEDQRKKAYPKGIFIDIFPGDRVAPGGIRRLFQYCVFAVNLLCSRGYTSGNGGLCGFIERTVLCLPKRIRYSLRKTTERVGARWNGKTDMPYVFPCTIHYCKKYYPKDLFENMGMISFNGRNYGSVGDPDGLLRIEYGDYMQLPPEEERTWKHHPIFIDFERNLEDICESNA